MGKETLMINHLRLMLAISMMTQITKNFSREQGKYTLTLHFDHMNLFRRKRCCSELIAIKNGDLVRTNFVKQWDVFRKDPSLIDCYMDAQLGMLYMWARVENKTIVKNIIERTQDELAQEFLSKNDEYGK